MANNSMLKMKMAVLLDMLRQDSDEDHPLPTNEICDRLAAKGIPCERKCVGTDIALLRQFGYEVMDTRSGKQKAYYIEDRSFSLPEIKILIDAVQAASFITEKKAAELIEKISYLGSSRRAEILQSNIVRFNTRKHTNEKIYYNVDQLEKAILLGQKASFVYYDLDENHKKIYRKDRKEYIVDPVTLVYMEDNYYLMCYSEKYANVASYRLDRMERTKVLKEPVCEAAKMMEEDIAAFTEQTFKMFSGETERVKLRFANHLIGTIYDKFGEDTKMQRLDPNSCTAEVNVQISPTFWGWLFQFVGEMQIVEPLELIDTYRALLSDALS